MNIINIREALFKDKFSYFKILGVGKITGYDAFNLPDGMDIYRPDGYIYGTPTKQQTKRSIFIAKNEKENIYKYVEIQIVDPNDNVNFQIPDQKNNLPIKISGFNPISGQNININLNNTLSGFYGLYADRLTGLLTYSSTGVGVYNVSYITGLNKIYAYGDASLSGDNLTGVAAISAGQNHNLALFYNGTITGWGNNTDNKALFGNNLTGVTGISAGSGHSLALLVNQTVTGWGLNNFNQSAGGINLNTISGISAGGLHSVALLSNGLVTGWGNNSYGQVSGTTSFYSSWNNTPVGKISNITQISAGREHTIALFNNGKITGWGNNNYGQVAGVTSFSNWSGTPASILTGVRKISAGNYHSIALLNDGSITGWGNNDYGQSISNLCFVTGANDCISENLNCSPTGYQIQDGFDTFGCPKYKCTPCPAAPDCGAGNPEATITGYDNNNCPLYECQLCFEFPCTGFTAPEQLKDFLVVENAGSVNLSLYPTNNWSNTSTPQIAWGDTTPYIYAPAENVPGSIRGTKLPWNTSHVYDGTLTVIDPENISVSKEIIGYDANNCPIYGPCNYTLTLNNQNAVYLPNYLPYEFSSNSTIEINIIGNLGAAAGLPALDTGPLPMGVTIKINIPSIAGSDPCNPTAGVVAGAGGGAGGPTAAIIVRNGINVIIKNDGKIGSGGTQGADNPCCCGEGGPGAGIPNGRGCGGCCGGEGPSSILCGGVGGGGSSAGAGLGGQSSWIADNRPQAAPCIILYPGASYSFDPSSSNPFFEGLGIVAYV